MVTRSMPLFKRCSHSPAYGIIVYELLRINFAMDDGCQIPVYHEQVFDLKPHKKLIWRSNIKKQYSYNVFALCLPLNRFHQPTTADLISFVRWTLCRDIFSMNCIHLYAAIFFVTLNYSAISTCAVFPGHANKAAGKITD